MTVNTTTSPGKNSFGIGPPSKIPAKYAAAPTIEGRQTMDGRMAVSVEEAGALLGVSRTTIYSLVHSGVVPSVRAGRRVLVPITGLTEMLAGAA